MIRTLCVICVFLSFHASAQKESSYRFAFYNFENLFDTEDDSLTRDEEFTPEGERRWTNYKYYKKLDQLARVIAVMGEWSSLDLLAYCEVENEACVQDLINRPALRREAYGIAHANSEDRRGIDVGLIYNKNRFQLIYKENIQLRSDELPSFRTRDILHAFLVSNEADSFHVFVNHWPSKYGGKLESEALRMLASKTLSENVNRLKASNPGAKIICMGDFNDDVFEPSIKYLEEASELINLSQHYLTKRGTHKYQETWSVIDQLFVSKSIQEGFLLTPHVFEEDFLLTADEKFLGEKPLRTFIGFRYNSEGFSDHLPVYLDLIKK